MSEKLILKELCRYRIGTYADVIYRNALLHSESEAFVYGEERITFQSFNSRANSLIHALMALGIKKGDISPKAAAHQPHGVFNPGMLPC